MEKIIKCLCGNNVQINYEEEVDLDKDPQILESILKGTFMSYTCTACKKLHKPEFKIVIIWNSKFLQMQVIPELDRGEFYLNKKDITSIETIIGFPEMADRIAVIKDGLEPVVIETIKSLILAKSEDDYPDNDINVWYYCSGPSGIEFHLEGIREDEVAVMIIPHNLYINTLEDFKKHPKSSKYTTLRIRSYLSVQNLLRPDVLK